MKCLDARIGTAIIAFFMGVGLTYLSYLVPNQNSQPPIYLSPVNVQNSKTDASVKQFTDSCESARQRAREMMSADWYRAATYTTSSGNLNSRRICSPTIIYPQEAIDAKISHTVTVRVLVNETGIVKSACAINGHWSLRKAAEAAARETIFTPNLLGGEPVNVRGTITFDFLLP